MEKFVKKPIIKRFSEIKMEGEPRVWVDKGYIWMETGIGYQYQITLRSCDTHRKIVAKVHHLGEKTWITLGMLRSFIELATKWNNLKLY